MNYRNLKFDPDTGYSINTKAVHEKLENLCDSCGRRLKGSGGCLAFNSMKRLQAKGVAAMPVSCKEFVPMINFAVTDHLDRDGLMNTMRLNGAWAGRCQPGGWVALVDKQGEPLRFAVVRQSFAVGREVALRDHAERNHMALARGLKGKEAAEFMRRTLKNVYGTGFFKNAKQISVIELAMRPG